MFRSLPRRRLGALLAAVAAVAVALALPGVAAADGGSWTVPGPGTGSGSRTTNIPGGGGEDWSCVALNTASGTYGLNESDGTLFGMAPYPNCGGGMCITNYCGANGNYRWCPVYFEVYRFYDRAGGDVNGKATKDKPVGVTRSTLMLPGMFSDAPGCSSEPAYQVTAPISWDANTSSKNPPTSSLTTAQPKNTDMYDNNLPSKVWRQSDTTMLTTGQPTAVSGSCASGQSANAVQQVLTSDTTSATVKNQTRSALGWLWAATAFGRTPINYKNLASART